MYFRILDKDFIVKSAHPNEMHYTLHVMCMEGLARMVTWYVLGYVKFVWLVCTYT